VGYVIIKTASTRRTLDKWKEKARFEADRFCFSMAAMVAALLSTTRKSGFLLVLPFMFATALRFAALELGLLVFIGFFTAKLRCYKLVNSFSRFGPLMR
jgi:hypothetical protein